MERIEAAETAAHAVVEFEATRMAGFGNAFTFCDEEDEDDEEDECDVPEFEVPAGGAE